MKAALFVIASLSVNVAFAQAPTLPYREIPQAPAAYSAGGLAARLIDGLGFRFYWATEGLRPQDLSFKHSPDTRTSLETLEHIYEMSVMIRNATTRQINEGSQIKKLAFAELREATLVNLKAASDAVRKATDDDFGQFTARFRDKNGALVEYPFWNMINGPMADCLWHVGQVVAMRRASGNPFTENVSLFMGTVR
jgi:hypothetical protein